MTTAVHPYTSDSSEVESMGIVKSNMLWAAGLGAVAVPVFDLAAVSLINMKMIGSLSKHYGVTFSQNLARNLIVSLLSGLTAKSLATGMIGTTMKSIPGLGSLFGFAAMPIFSGAVTYAIGTVFVQHFEMGGTLLDFDPNKTRGAFREAFEKGKEEVSSTKS